MDGSILFKLAKDLGDFSRDEAIRVLFPNNPPNIVIGEILTTRISVEDKLLHYTMVGCILPSSNTHIIKEELSLM